MAPFGCEGGVQNTIALLSEVPTMLAISTTPAAKYSEKHKHQS